MNNYTLLAVCLLAAGAAGAQTPAENNARMAAGAQPIFRVSVTSHTMKAVNYQHRSGATKVDLRGTTLLPKGHGYAKVGSKQGRIDISAEFEDLTPASQFGGEYLTYVMWAITPEGRPQNLGEVLLNGAKSKLYVSTDLQVFGLIVTAEPYMSVTMPSDLIVMENFIRTDTVGKVEEMDAKYELLERGQYSRLANFLHLTLDAKTPLELYEARNAVNIARGFGADKFAAETFAKAEKSLAAAEAYHARKAGLKPVIMTAREAAQTAEDGRLIAVKRQEENLLAAERQKAADQVQKAETSRAAAQTEAERVSREAEAARVRAAAEADRLTREKEAQAAASTAEAARIKAESDARAAASVAEAARIKAEADAGVAAAVAEAARIKAASEASALAAKAESDARMAAANSEAERLKRDNEAQRAASQAALELAAKQKAQLEAEKAELRSTLLQQFNAVLQTRDTARGLIVNMSDVLFDTGKSTLRPLAREKLAKVAGIISGHPGLMLDVEGHTDSVGSDTYNQTLSEQRGATVRDYLTKEGMASASVTTKGFGESQPVATNDTSAGRQLNRRVELVISGEIIGKAIGTPIAVK